MPNFSTTLAHARAPFILVPLLLAAATAQAADTTISSSSATAQTVSANSSLTVSATGTLTVSGKTPAISAAGANITLSNLGTINQSGTGRVIVDTASTSTLVVNNGSASNGSALMQTANGDVIQLGNFAGESVTLNNYGRMISLNPSAGGSQAVDFSNIASGSNVVNNFFGGLMQAAEADAVRPGANGVVNNGGTIKSTTKTGSSSDGIDGQANNGIVVNNTGLVEGGRHGITGGAADAGVLYTMNVVNALGGTIQGDNGSGINIDGFNANQTVTVTNHGTIVGHGVTGDGDGVDVDGLVTLVNTGVIRSLNAVPDSGDSVAYSEGISVGGGHVTNSGLIEGLVDAGNTAGKGIGITLTGNDIKDKNGKDTGVRDGIYGATTVTNQSGGVIRGQNSSAIVIKGNPSAFGVTLNNDAGATMQGGGTADAAIAAGVDPVTVNNAGRIDGSSSGKAFAGGGGQVTFNITGGQAVVLGSIDGGSAAGNKLKVDPGAGNSFAYASGIANFDQVEVASGTVTLSGKSRYTGTTVVDAGATLALLGADRLAAASKLDLEGGKLALVNAGGANGQEFAVLSVGKDSAIDLGASSLTFDALGADASGRLAVSDWLASTSPSFALRFLGDLTHDAEFLALMGDTTIDGLAASYAFDGRYTDVTAVPEPANVALLLAGLGLLGATARRRKAA